jgi:hypothetical protein
MLIGLATLLILLFSGGPEEVFLIPNAEKNLKSIIADKDKKSQAVALFKTTKQEIKAFNKELKQKSKELQNNSYRGNLTEPAVKQLLKESFEHRKNIQSHLIDQRLQLRELLTEDEWDRFMEVSIQEMASKEKKAQKAQVKKGKEAEKLLAKLKSSLEKNISDADKLDKALKDYSDFEQLIIGKFEQLNALTFENNSAVKDYSVDKETLSIIYSDLNGARQELYNGFLTMRSSMTAYLTEDEWSAISKNFIELL